MNMKNVMAALAVAMLMPALAPTAAAADASCNSATNMSALPGGAGYIESDDSFPPGTLERVIPTEVGKTYVLERGSTPSLVHISVWVKDTTDSACDEAIIPAGLDNPPAFTAQSDKVYYLFVENTHSDNLPFEAAVLKVA